MDLASRQPADLADDKMIVTARLAEVYHDGPRGWTGVTVHARHMPTMDEWVIAELAHHGVWKQPAPARQAALL